MAHNDATGSDDGVADLLVALSELERLDELGPRRLIPRLGFSLWSNDTVSAGAVHHATAGWQGRKGPSVSGTAGLLDHPNG